jgi:hypothetical protein
VYRHGFSCSNFIGDCTKCSEVKALVNDGLLTGVSLATGTGKNGMSIGLHLVAFRSSPFEIRKSPSQYQTAAFPSPPFSVGYKTAMAFCRYP